MAAGSTTIVKVLSTRSACLTSCLRQYDHFSNRKVKSAKLHSHTHQKDLTKKISGEHPCSSPVRQTGRYCSGPGSIPAHDPHPYPSFCHSSFVAIIWQKPLTF